MFSSSRENQHSLTGDTKSVLYLEVYLEVTLYWYQVSWKEVSFSQRVIFSLVFTAFYLSLSISMLVKGLSQGLLSDHECLTLGRAFGQRAYPILPTLVRLVQDDLHKHNFTQFAALETALAQCCQVRGNHYPMRVA